MSWFRRFLQANQGVTAIEYGLIAGLIALVIIVAVTSVGQHLISVFSLVNSGFPPT